jgi:predicted membrane GTPase involved in stress response
MGDLALALIQVDDSVPLAVLLGESVGGYTLAAVDQESATLTSLSETLTLPVVEPVLAGRSLGEPVQIQIDPRNLDQFRGRMQEVLRRQMPNRGGGGQP